MPEQLLNQLHAGDSKALARCLTLVENSVEGYEQLLQNLHFSKNCAVVGITGPPGAGKSTLINALIHELLQQNKQVAILAIDPTSPFNYGALLGDRIRMGEHFTNPHVFIRSMASRGSLGGLAPKIYEAVDVLKAAGFDYVIVETVGVGQSEVEIAGLADTTVVVVVPEAGDEIQTIKSGVMEIADVFVVNKADRDGAISFHKNLVLLAHTHATAEWETPVVKTVASKNEGLQELAKAIEKHLHSHRINEKKKILLAQKALNMIRDYRTRDVDTQQLINEIAEQMNKSNFNLYRYITKWNN